jgi:hypothetical protein
LFATVRGGQPGNRDIQGGKYPDHLVEAAQQPPVGS